MIEHPNHLNIASPGRSERASPRRQSLTPDPETNARTTHHQYNNEVDGLTPHKSIAFGLGLCVLANTIIMGVLEYWPALYVGIAVFFTAILLSPYSEIATFPALLYGLLSFAIYLKELTNEWPWHLTSGDNVNYSLILDWTGIALTTLLFIVALWTMQSVRNYREARQRAIRRRQATSPRKPIIQIYPHQTPEAPTPRTRVPSPAPPAPPAPLASPRTPPRVELATKSPEAATLSPNAAAKTPPSLDKPSRPCYIVEQNSATGQTTIQPANINYTHNPIITSPEMPRLSYPVTAPPPSPAPTSPPMYAVAQPMYQQAPPSYPYAYPQAVNVQSPVQSPYGGVMGPTPNYSPVSPVMAPQSPVYAPQAPFYAPPQSPGMFVQQNPPYPGAPCGEQPTYRVVSPGSGMQAPPVNVYSSSAPAPVTMQELIATPAPAQININVQSRPSESA